MNFLIGFEKRDFMKRFFKGMFLYEVNKIDFLMGIIVWYKCIDNI